MSKARVAVYGSLLSGLGNHGLLEEATLLGEGKTEPVFSMYDLGYYPGITENGKTPIKIEVYEVDDTTFGRLDMLEGYPSFYNRKLIPTQHGVSWIYFPRGS